MPTIPLGMNIIKMINDKPKIKICRSNKPASTCCIPVRITAPIIDPNIEPMPPMTIMAMKSMESSIVNASGDRYVIK